MKNQIERAIERVNDGTIESAVLIKFFTTHPEVKINWQEKKDAELLSQIQTAFLKKSNSQEFKNIFPCLNYKNAIDHVHASGLIVGILKDKKFRYLYKSTDIILYNPTFSSEFIYLIPTSVFGVGWISHFSCGGESARWCLNLNNIDKYGKVFSSFYGHKCHDFFIVMLHKDAFSQNTSSRKYLIEFTPAANCVPESKMYEYKDNVFKCKPLCFDSKNEIVKQFSEEENLKNIISEIVIPCFLNKDKIPLYEFTGWNSKFLTFLSKNATYRTSYSEMTE